MAADEGWRAAILARLRARLARLGLLAKNLTKVSHPQPPKPAAAANDQDKTRSMVRR
jgi:hypothetical protein